jgi:predicted membrane protein
MRRGSWLVPRDSVMISVVGGADLDMTQAVFDSPEVTITWWSLLGGLTLVVPPGTKVDVSGFRLLGGRDVKVTPGNGGNAQIVHIVANTLVGGVKVYST